MPHPRATAEQLHKVEKKLNSRGGWSLSIDLFPGSKSGEFYDFMSEDYVEFLDLVSSLEDLVRGLEELSPFADDALAVAKGMTGDDFIRFKVALTYERRWEDGLQSRMPKKWWPILFPILFMDAPFLAKRFEIGMGVVLIQMMRVAVQESGALA